ncbi:dehydrogenase [Scheffersomyces stipitis CBS 6054]|uniref:Dehydrogenase n=1 Tax=Scheffersomyces stipitis (strain ATCC 58785 / CBS 6054 / NBRC 10063 / NRRL Y-11545) TaxID=322104 RepID=A3M0N2_PICST|nr:dehydrogenase [Scheffersomyces stipitis CBS 6054]ABN68733.1 dehydrogenase [Scheffersomyces stipitis CBS 6054]
MSKVFITGATGYIGGQVLYELLNNKDGRKYDVTALVRSQQKAEKLLIGTNNQISTVIGSLDDVDFIKQQVEANDIIINTANVDHVPSAQAVSDALVASKDKKIYIHTSGTSILGDGLSPDKGDSHKVYSDKYSIDEINSFPDTQPHRPVDRIVLDIHNKNPNVQVVVICPSTIYGISNGYDNLVSAQVPLLITSFVKYGKGYTVYKGDEIWNHIHIKDLGDLYYLILTKLQSGEDIPVNGTGYYFGSLAIEGEETISNEPSSIEHRWRQVSEVVAEKLFTKGLIGSKEVVSLEPQEIAKINDSEWSPFYWGTYSRSRGDNGYAIGWKPKFTSNKEFFDSFDADIDYLVKRN